MKLIPFDEKVIQQYNLNHISIKDRWVHVEVLKGMDGLPQVKILVQELLEKRLDDVGYMQSKLPQGM